MPAAIAWTAAQIEAAGVHVHQLGAGASQAVPAWCCKAGGAAAPGHRTAEQPAGGRGAAGAGGARPARQGRRGRGTPYQPELLVWQRELLQAQSQARLAASRLARDEQLYAEGIIPGLRRRTAAPPASEAQLALQERRQALQALGLAGGGCRRSWRCAPLLRARCWSCLPCRDSGWTPACRARIARSGQLALVLQATPEQAGRLRVGDTPGIAGCTNPARLTAITPQVNSANQSVQLRADFTAAEDCLRLQQFVEATVPRARQGDAGT
jgi:hypothetical protein